MESFIFGVIKPYNPTIMKKTTLLAYCFILVTAFSFNSCDTENIDPVLVDNNVNPDPDGGVSTGDYWPMAINNQWVYKRNGMIQEPMKIIGTETINGNLYYKFDNFTMIQTEIEEGEDPAESIVHVRKNNGNYYTRSVMVAEVPEFEIPNFEMPAPVPFEYIILKDYAAVGQTWSEQISQNIDIILPEGMPIAELHLVSTVRAQTMIVGKDIAISVNNVNYTDVIKVRVVLTGTVTGLPAGFPAPPSVVVTNYYWFAKNHGPIKLQTEAVPQMSQEYNSELISHVIN